MTDKTTQISTNGQHAMTGVDPEVLPKAKRRRFSAAYKRRIVEEAERCAYGEVGALLRREGLYSSHLANWRREWEAGALSSSPARRRGPQPQQSTAEKETVRLVRENKRLRKQLEHANLIIDAQKKLAQILGETMSVEEQP